MREKCKSRQEDKVRTSNVLPSPGLPSSSTWPPASSPQSTCSTTVSCPTITDAIALFRRSLRSRAWESRASNEDVPDAGERLKGRPAYSQSGFEVAPDLLPILFGNVGVIDGPNFAPARLTE